MHLLRRYDVKIASAHVVVIGRGVTVGRPLGLLLTCRSENATATLCHTGTRDLAGLVGDVHPGVWEVAGHVSPNPGGVGPLTRAFLLTNVVELAERQ